MEKISLSPSAINLFEECPRCFWLEKIKNIKRPRGLFPSLPGGMDIVIKKYFDIYREKNILPPEIEGKVNGKLVSDFRILERWRSWRSTDLVYIDEKLSARLSGALDDCLVDNGLYIPLDYKTRGTKLQDDPRTYYQTQLDIYCLLLESCGYKTAGIAYLLYWWPVEVTENGIVKFQVEPVKVETDILSAKYIFESAVKCLNSPIPEASGECEFCILVEERKKEEDILVQKDKTDIKLKQGELF